MDGGARSIEKRDQNGLQQAVRLGVQNVSQPDLFLPKTVQIRRRLHVLDHESLRVLYQSHLLSQKGCDAARVYQLLCVKEKGKAPRTIS